MQNRWLEVVLKADLTFENLAIENFHFLNNEAADHRWVWYPSSQNFKEAENRDFRDFRPP